MNLKISYVLAFGLMIFLNYWSATDVGVVADEEQALIQPAGYTFSIWGVIYFLLFLWLVRLFFTEKKALIKDLHVWVLLNFLLNGLWILAFTNQWIGVSTGIIFVLLGTLTVLYQKIRKSHGDLLDRIPYSIYLGWVFYATVVNVFTWLFDLQVFPILGIPEVGWTILALLVVTVSGAWFAFKSTDPVVVLTFMWATIGIFVESGFQEVTLAITLACSLLVYLLTVGKISVSLKKR